MSQWELNFFFKVATIFCFAKIKDPRAWAAEEVLN